MTNYQKSSVKLTNTQLKKIKSAAKMRQELNKKFY